MSQKSFLLFVFVASFLSRASYGATSVSGAVSGHWTVSGSPYVVTSDGNVSTGQTLVIDAGVQVKMASAVNFTVNGVLETNGTSGTPVLITSLQDGTTAAAPGQWGNFAFAGASSSCTLLNTVIRYGTQVVLSNSSPQFNGVMIASMSSVAVSADLNSFPSGVNNIASGCPLNGIDLAGGVIPTSGKWIMLGLPYVIRSGQIVVSPGIQLTLAPGIVVKATDRQTAGNQLNIQGTLTAIGTSTAPIVFTSIRDSTVGGNTDAFEGNVAPAPGDWAGFFFYGSPNSQLNHVVVRYGGGPYSNGSSSLYINASNATIANSTITLSGQSGFYITGSPAPTITQTMISSNTTNGIVSAQALTTISSNRILANTNWAIMTDGDVGPISGNLFDGNGGGIYFGSVYGSPVLTDNTFKNTKSDLMDVYPNVFVQDGGGNTADATNHIVGIDLVGYTYSRSAWTQSGTWGFKTWPYLIRFDQVGIGNGSHTANITIAPGVVVKSLNANNGNGKLNVSDTLTAVGTSSAPITFTSLRDSTVGGNTDAFEGNLAPAPGDWDNLYFSGSLSSQLNHVVVRYGGNSASYGPSSIYVNNSSPTVSNLTVTQSASAGLYFTGAGASSTVQNSTFQNNVVGIDAESSASPAITNDTISGNSSYGVLNGDGSHTVQAPENYWGSASGPTNSTNPSGTGDRVSDHVLFTPFLTQPSTGTLADVLPPRTTLAAGTPSFGTHPIAISTSTVLTLSAVDDRTAVGDGLGVGVAQTQYVVDGGTFTVYVASFTLSHPGFHTISFFSTDLLGHVEVTTSTTVNVDTAPPVTTITYSPSPYIDASSHTYLSGGTQIGFSLQDSTAPVAFTQYRIDPGTATVFQTTPVPFTLHEGTHTIQFQSQDVLGNLEAVQSMNVYVDTTLPVSHLTIQPTLGSLSDGSVLIDAQSYFIFTATDPVSRQVSSGLKDIQVAIDTGAFALYTSSFVITAQGRHTVQWFSQDHVGNSEVTQSTTVVLSTGTPPVTQITYAGAQYVDASSNVYVSSVTSISFAVNNHGNGTLFTHYWIDASTATAALTFLNALTLPEGLHQIQFQSEDLRGTLEPLRSSTLRVDATPPQSKLSVGAPSSVGASSVFVASTTPLGLTAVDPTSHGVSSGLNQIQWSLDGGALNVYVSSLTLAAEGPHTLAWFAQDHLGNSEVSRSTSVVMDETPPTIQIIFSPNALIDSSNRVLIDTGTRVAFEISDALSGVGAASYRVDGSSTTPFQTYSSTFTIALGTHMLTARALDRVGNLKTVAPFTVYVSTTSPTPVGDTTPTAGTLTDGTPIIGSPVPVTVPLLGTPSASPTVQSIAFTPVSPVGRGTLGVTITFSKPMDNTVYPVVTFTPNNQSSQTLTPTSFVGATWSGSVLITGNINSGAAVLEVSGAADPSGHVITPSVSSVLIAVALPPAPASLTAAPQNATLLLNWSPVANAVSYNVYRSKTPLTSRIGATPLATNIASASFADTPSPDTPLFYYAVTAVMSDGTESPLSTSVSARMPLPPVITSPFNGASVDYSSTVIQGLAQPGALVDLSLVPSTGTLATLPVGAGGAWSTALTLGHGPFEISARTRSSVTSQVSASTATVFITIIDFPLAPALTVSAGDTTITLSWAPSSQSGVIGYNLYRDGSTAPLNVAPLPVTQASYQDLALTDSRAYSYVITAVKSGNLESLPSPAVQATPLAGSGWGQ